MRRLLPLPITLLGLSILGPPTRVLAQQSQGSADARPCEVRVTAATPDGRPVEELTAQDFSLEIGGKPTAVNEVTIDDSPLTTVLLIDVSGSMTNTVNAAIQHAASFARTFKATDQLHIGSFADRIVIGPAVQAERTDANQIRSQLTLGNPSFVYDAIWTALDSLGSAAGRKTVVLFSDGDDDQSRHRAKDVIARARREEVSVFLVGYRTTLFGRTHDPGPEVLQLVGDTGGGFVPVRSADEAQSAASRLAAQVRGRYRLTFSSSGLKPKTQDVRVVVTRERVRIQRQRVSVAHCTPH